MPRRQRDLDPDGGPVTELARELRALRAVAGDPKFDTMARRTGRSKTALAEAAGGRRLPRWETVEDFVRACDADPAGWRGRWESARSTTAATTTGTATTGTATTGTATTGTATTGTATTGTATTGTLEPPATPSPDTAPATTAPPDTPSPATPPPDAAPGVVPARHRSGRVLAGALVAVVVAAAAGFAVGRTSASPYAPIGPLLRAVEVQNKVALGADRLVEDRTPAYLSTLPLAYCASPSRSCKVPGTEMGSGAGIVANCVTHGQRMWNYDLGEDAARDNADRAESDLWYRASFPDGRSGYLAEVYVTRGSRGGLGLPDCGPLTTR